MKIKWCLKSRKTTAAGLGGIAIALGTALTAFSRGEPVSVEVVVVALLAGIGLLFAKDGDTRSADLEKPKQDDN